MRPMSARSHASCEGASSCAPATSRAQEEQSAPPMAAEKYEMASSPHAAQPASSGRQPPWASTFMA